MNIPGWIFGFGKDLEQFIIGQEEEAWEVEALLFQIGVETSLNHVQECIALL